MDCSPSAAVSFLGTVARIWAHIDWRLQRLQRLQVLVRRDRALAKMHRKETPHVELELDWFADYGAKQLDGLADEVEAGERWRGLTRIRVAQAKRDSEAVQTAISAIPVLARNALPWAGEAVYRRA